MITLVLRFAGAGTPGRADGGGPRRGYDPGNRLGTSKNPSHSCVNYNLPLPSGGGGVDGGAAELLRSGRALSGAVGGGRSAGAAGAGGRDFELFRAELEAALQRSDRAKGGRPPYDAVLMFKVLVLQTLYTLSDDQTEYQLRDRLSFMRFVGLALHDPVPDAKTIWLLSRAADPGGCDRAAVRPVRCRSARAGRPRPSAAC